MNITELYTDYGDGEAYYCKGHVSKAEFSKRVKGEWGGDALALDEIYHVYARLIPVADCSYDQAFRVCQKGRGAFAATFYGWAIPDGAWLCDCPDCTSTAALAAKGEGV